MSLKIFETWIFLFIYLSIYFLSMIMLDCSQRCWVPFISFIGRKWLIDIWDLQRVASDLLSWFFFLYNINKSLYLLNFWPCFKRELISQPSAKKLNILSLVEEIEFEKFLSFISYHYFRTTYRK